MKIYTQNAGYAPMEVLPCKNLQEYKVGQALTLSNGEATVCTGATKPEYICMTSRTGKTGEEIEVVKITDDMIFEGELNEKATTAKVGGKVKLHTDGIKFVEDSGNTSPITIVKLPEGIEAKAKVLVRI